jgi:hypothetical protein
MATFSAKINAKSFGRKFNKMLDSPKFKKDAYDIMDETYQHAKQELFKEFNDSKITQEIERGPNAENESGLLDGYGNLFSYIGFPVDEQPIENLRDYLDAYLDNFQQTVRKENYWYFRIPCPSKKEIEAQTPMPWEEGNSWVSGIEEEGITNLSHYLYGESNRSRSTMGLQITPEYRPGAAMHTSPYLLKMLEDFRERFEV